MTIAREATADFTADDFAGPVSHSFVSQRLKLHYVDWGNGQAPPLILQHGGRDHCRSWDWTARALRGDWHVMAPDLRGHGDSAWSPDGSYTNDAYVYDFAQFVDQLGYDRVTIVAHSLGGNVATQFAGLFPGKVAKLVNIEGLGPAPALIAEREAVSYGAKMREWIGNRRGASGRQPRRYPTLEAAYRRMKAENGFLSDAQARHLTIHGASRNEDGTYSWKFDNYLNVWPPTHPTRADMAALWGEITAPMLLLYGADSWASNPERDGRIAHFADARVIEFADAGHWLHHDQFDRFIREVRAFL